MSAFLIAVLLFLLTACDSGKAEVPEQETMQTMLEDHCENQSGMVAVTSSPVGTFIQCYQGKKMIWRTRF